MANHAQLIRVPAHTAERIRKIEQARTALRQETGKEPTVSAIAARCEILEDKVRQLLQLNPQTVSLETPTGDSEESTLGILLQDSDASQPQEELVRKELERILDKLLGALDARQQQILRLHFGMEDGHVHSLEEISKLLGISKERVRQVEKQAMDKLQKLGANLGLEDFLNE